MTTNNKPSAAARFIMTRTVVRLQHLMGECQAAYIRREPVGECWAEYARRERELRAALRMWA